MAISQSRSELSERREESDIRGKAVPAIYCRRRFRQRALARALPRHGAPPRRSDPQPVAGITIVARPSLLHRLAEVLQDESRAALRALTVVHHGLELHP